MSDEDFVLDEDGEPQFVRDDEPESSPPSTPSVDSTPAAATAVLPTVDEVQERLRRFASLRSAERALTPSVAALREESSQARGQELRQELESLAGQWKALAAAESPAPDRLEAIQTGFERVDVELSELSQKLRGFADQVEAVQLRSTLPDIAHRHRREVCGLLDLLIEDIAGMADRRATIEYVVTLLSTSDSDDVRRIAHDPARLTPAMQALCDSIETEYGTVSDEYELAFFEAANVDSSVNVFARVQELRSKKEELGTACFLPGVLRAIVTYNVRMANEISSAATSSREDDLAFEDLVESEVLEPQVAEQTPSELDFVEPSLQGEPEESISIHESNGIDQIRNALGRRMRGVPIGSCVSERIALAVDLTSLDVEELDILGAEPTDDPDSETTASILVLGLMNAVFPAIEESLLELGISRKQLHEDWTQELDHALQGRISTLLAANSYETACGLSEFKTKHLYASISSLAREKRDRDGVQPRQSRERPDQAKAEMIEAATEAQASLKGGTGNWVGPMREIALGETQSGRRIRGGVAAAAIVSVLLALAFNVVQSSEVEVADLRPRELSDISPYLQTAYRNGNGSGVLVIGRVDSDWHGLEGHERVAAAEKMRTRFLSEKVRDVMIYDENRRLQIQIAGGKLRKPSLARTAPTPKK